MLANSLPSLANIDQHWPVLAKAWPRLGKVLTDVGRIWATLWAFSRLALGPWAPGEAACRNDASGCLTPGVRAASRDHPPCEAESQGRTSQTSAPPESRGAAQAQHGDELRGRRVRVRGARVRLRRRPRAPPGLACTLAGSAVSVPTPCGLAHSGALWGRAPQQLGVDLQVGFGVVLLGGSSGVL